MLPLSEHRTSEWDEAIGFNSGCSASRDPLEVHSLFTAKLDRHECLKELSQLNVDLHAHWRALQELDESGGVNFVTFCDHPPPPVGDGVSLAEKLLIMAQRFQQAITNLIWVVKHEPKPLHQPGHVVADDGITTDSSSSYVGEPLLGPLGREEDSFQPTFGDTLAEPDVLLSSPFVCVLVSCYVQMINLWEIMFFHAHRRAIGIDRYPLTLSDPSKGVQLGAFYMFSGRLTSMFYCQAVLYFLDNIDRGLGILPEQRQQGVSGLISHARHFDMLQKELGGQFSEGGNERVRGLKDMVEKARLHSVQESGI
ncbi:putative c6 zinc finger domain-containing protein [Daldinia childiae]|uniref:putative c6 zinc finger domain-containing protein n=1 Tax=Daldinia childiae TaxID=326645 RepID=UPI001444AA1A|nr:putative c6 zinc finger domain-containing protein [Daldinia childiae]KAF3070557.1 putative c6 zinc finger domain-containing protein [Daldinia childiae]